METSDGTYDNTGNAFEVRKIIDAPLKFFKTNPDVISPAFATRGSACFDIHAFLPVDAEVELHRSYSTHPQFMVVTGATAWPGVTLHPGDRVLIPTGLIFDIDINWSVRLHSRSGVALKKGLILTNAEGIIDSDYVDPVFVMITNTSSRPRTIEHNDRICQAEMVPSPYYDLEEITTPPTRKTGRTGRMGGFGSTGR